VRLVKKHQARLLGVCWWRGGNTGHGENGAMRKALINMHGRYAGRLWQDDEFAAPACSKCPSNGLR